MNGGRQELERRIAFLEEKADHYDSVAPARALEYAEEAEELRKELENAKET